MIIIPAIDLKNGNCVRLIQGKINQDTVYSEEPAQVAQSFEKIGVKRLHIVDLNGAFSGKPENIEAIKGILKTTNLTVELGGGIRTLATIEKYIKLGVDYIILGTVIAENKDLVREACKRFPGRIIAGIDAVNGKVATKGWVEVTDILALELAKEMENIGIREIIYTDISRDGMQTGVNVESTYNLQRQVGIPVIASGGVKDMYDIKKLKEKNIYGVITGRAVYEGSLNLKDAIEFCNVN
jgi:phosphoribosylformimino-5-aminoimidazole carboxamide ribotide isomerase